MTAFVILCYYIFMAIISDDDKKLTRSFGKNPNIKAESIDYDKTFENSSPP